MPDPEFPHLLDMQFGPAFEAAVGPEGVQYARGVVTAMSTPCRHCGETFGECWGLASVRVGRCCDSCPGHHGPENA